MTNLFGRLKTSSLRLVTNKKTEEQERKKKVLLTPSWWWGKKSHIQGEQFPSFNVHTPVLFMSQNVIRLDFMVLLGVREFKEVSDTSHSSEGKHMTTMLNTKYL